MSSDAIQVENLSKRYHLGTIGYGSLQHDLRALWARSRGKEDPNAKIGEKGRLDKHGEFWALQDIDFKVERGDRVGIVGRNGAGKSTLLKLLSRVTSPTTGKIRVRGRIASLLEVGTGFHPELTGRENVYLNGAILGMKRREIQAKFDEIVDFAGVSQFVDTPVKRYSSGMYVRLAFSVAAHLDSEILIVDEVLAVGDSEFQEKCLGKMEQISRGEGRTILLVSHYLASVRALCNRGILLEKGRVSAQGELESVLDQYSAAGKSAQFVPFYVEELDLWVNSIRVNPQVDHRVRPFEPLTVEIKLLAGRPLEGLGYQIMISQHDFRGRLFTTNSALSKSVDLALSKGSATVVCHIERFMLSSGTYSLGFGIDLPHVRFYYQENEVLTFSVDEILPEGSRLPTSPEYGKTYLDHRWSVEAR